MPADDAFLPWQHAWRRALYGEGGFYLRPEGPAGHFRTASHAAAPALAVGLLRLAERSGCTAVLDVGAGRGELLAAMAAELDGAAGAPRLDGAAGAPRLDGAAGTPRLHGVDVVPRPGRLPAAVGWSDRVDRVPDGVWDGRLLLIAWELLDVVPCPVLELDDDAAPRTVLVDPRTGRERLAGPPDEAALAWCRRWAPLDAARPGHRVEVGLPRDELWAGLVRRVRDGVLLAVDYAHLSADRPPAGSLSGFRSGRAVPPVPDGSCDITAHVAIDAVADAGLWAGAAGSLLLDQREALLELGVREPQLLDPGALGGFSWLQQARSPSTVPGRPRSAPPAPGWPARPAAGPRPARPGG